MVEKLQCFSFESIHFLLMFGVEGVDFFVDVAECGRVYASLFSSRSLASAALFLSENLSLISSILSLRLSFLDIFQSCCLYCMIRL